MTAEKNPWLNTAEEDAALKLEWKKKYELRQSIPEYQRSERDRIWLCRLLSSLLYVETLEFSIEPPKYSRQRDQGVVAYRMGEVVSSLQKPLTYDSDGYVTKAYRDFCREAERLHFTLRNYTSHYRHSHWKEKSRGREHAEEDFGQYNMDILRKGVKRGSASFDVGSSLYLYQQMYERKITQEPSLGKAAFLVKNAPLREPVPEKPSPRGKWEIIQEQWRNNVENAHYWAAIVAITGSPLQYTENLLLDFICVADVDRFQRLTRTFYEFRQRAIPPRVANNRRTYLNQIPLEVPDHLAEVAPYGPLDIANPLKAYQWEALSHYGKKTP